jgi:hypothetical protein
MLITENKKSINAEVFDSGTELYVCLKSVVSLLKM